MIVSNRMVNKKIIEHDLEVLSSNSDNSDYSLSIINLCRYLAETYEDEFIPAAGDSDLTLSSEMSAVETTSIISDNGLNISQSCLFLRILRKN